MVDLMKAPSSAARLPFRRGSVEYSLGTEADHEAVYQTFYTCFMVRIESRSWAH